MFTLRLASLAMIATLTGAVAIQDGDEAEAPVKGVAKTAVGHLLVVGCESHDGKSGASCAASCLSKGDSFMLQCPNHETYFLHGIGETERAFLRGHDGRAVVVKGRFFWQGAYRMLQPQSVLDATDEELAKFGAAEPEHEMAKYFLTVIRPGSKAEEIAKDKKRVGELMKGHFDNIGKQAAAGNLMIAGPFGQHTPKKYSGLFIYRVKSLEEAEAATAADPAIAAGLFEVDTVPWYGPKSLGY